MHIREAKMLFKLYEVFKDFKLFNSQLSFIELVMAKEINLTDDAYAAEIYVNLDSRKAKKILVSDFSSINKMHSDSCKEAYKEIWKGYDNLKNRDKFLRYFEKNISKKIDGKEIKREIIKLLISKEQFPNDKNPNKIPVPNKLRDKIEGSERIEEIVYYLFRYAITKNFEFNIQDTFVDDREEYYTEQLNNLMDGNLNKRGMVDFLVKKENTVAMFEKATVLLFKNFANESERDINRNEALGIYQSILANHPNMPLANWGIGYIILNYHKTYREEMSKRRIIKEAYEYASKAANYNCGAAFTLLGRIYDKASMWNINCIDEFKNKSSIEYYKESYELGYLYALNNLGKCKLRSANLADDKKEKIKFTKQAFGYFKDLADSCNEPYSCNEVGRFYSGQYPYSEIKVDLSESIKYWQTAIDFDSGYYSFWPRYNIIYFSLKGLIEGTLDNYDTNQIYSYYQDLIEKKFQYEFEKDDDGSEKRIDYDNHACYSDFLDKIELYLTKDELSADDKKAIRNIIFTKNN